MDVSKSSSSRRREKITTTTTTRRVWIVRHGERVDEVDKLWTTKNPKIYHDPPLTKRGQEQAMKVANFLGSFEGKVKFDLIYCSPLMRAIQTAEQISNVLSIPVCVNNGLGYFAAATALYKAHNKGKTPAFVEIQEIVKQCPLGNFKANHDRKEDNAMHALHTIVKKHKGKQ